MKNVTELQKSIPNFNEVKYVRDILPKNAKTAKMLLDAGFQLKSLFLAGYEVMIFFEIELKRSDFENAGIKFYNKDKEPANNLPSLDNYLYVDLHKDITAAILYRANYSPSEILFKFKKELSSIIMGGANIEKLLVEVKKGYPTKTTSFRVNLILMAAYEACNINFESSSLSNTIFHKFQEKILSNINITSDDIKKYLEKKYCYDPISPLFKKIFDVLSNDPKNLIHNLTNLLTNLFKSLNSSTRSHALSLSDKELSKIVTNKLKEPRTIFETLMTHKKVITKHCYASSLSGYDPVDYDSDADSDDGIPTGYIDSENYVRYRDNNNLVTSGNSVKFVPIEFRNFMQRNIEKEIITVRRIVKFVSPDEYLNFVNINTGQNTSAITIINMLGVYFSYYYSYGKCRAPSIKFCETSLIEFINSSVVNNKNIINKLKLMYLLSDQYDKYSNNISEECLQNILFIKWISNLIDLINNEIPNVNNSRKDELYALKLNFLDAFKCFHPDMLKRSFLEFFVFDEVNEEIRNIFMDKVKFFCCC